MRDSKNNFIGIVAAQAKNIGRPFRLGFVYDVPEPLESFGNVEFPSDASAEWESKDTLNKMRDTWRELGFDVVDLPLDSHFLQRWAVQCQEIDIVHSVVEAWGSPAREGWIPSLCEMSGVPFIGADPVAQGISMKKSVLKTLCATWGVPTAPSWLLRSPEEFASVPLATLELPHFLKPDAEGSGMGVDAAHSLCRSPNQSRQVFEKLLLEYPDGVMLESWLPGAEYTTAIWGPHLEWLPPARIEVETGVYGLSNKSKEHMGEKVIFDGIPAIHHADLEKHSRAIWKELGCRDFVRLDWKCDTQGNICFLEANPLAGLSWYYSVLPKMAEHAGHSYQNLFAGLFLSAWSRRSDRSYWYGKARLQNHRSRAEERLP